MASAHPIRSKQSEIDCNGTTIDIISSNFGSRLFILLSERNLQKMGTMLLVRRESKGPGAVSTFSVNTLLGLDSAEIHVFGRAFGGHILIPEIPDTSIILGLGIRNPDPSIIPSLLRVLDEVDVWSLDSQ